MFTERFFKDASERAIATFAQTFIAMITVLAPMGDGQLLEINYAPVFLISLIAAGLSVLKAVVAAKKAGTDTASLTVNNKEF